MNEGDEKRKGKKKKGKKEWRNGEMEKTLSIYHSSLRRKRCYANMMMYIQNSLLIRNEKVKSILPSTITSREGGSALVR